VETVTKLVKVTAVVRTVVVREGMTGYGSGVYGGATG
jgi:hypothetical protein